MNKDQVIEHVRTTIDMYTKGLSRADYREVLEEISSDCEIRLEGLDADDASEQEE